VCRRAVTATASACVHCYVLLATAVEYGRWTWLDLASCCICMQLTCIVQLHTGILDGRFLLTLVNYSV